MDYGSILASAGSGAATGATIGGGWGALAGGIIGAGADIFGQMSSKDEMDSAMDAINQQLKAQYSQGKLTLDQYQKEYDALTAQYKNALKNADFESAGKIDFDKDSYNRDDYRKSNEKQIIEATKNNMKGENTGMGSSWGSGATGNILNAVVKQQEELDQYADQRMNEQREFDYKLASDEATQRLNALTSKLNALGKVSEIDTTKLGTYYGGLVNLQNVANQNANNASLFALANQPSGNSSTIADAGGSILTAFNALNK